MNHIIKIKRSVSFRIRNKIIIDRLAQRYDVVPFRTIERYPLSHASNFDWEIIIPVQTQHEQIHLYSNLLKWGKENLPGSLKDSFVCGTVNG